MGWQAFQNEAVPAFSYKPCRVRASIISYDMVLWACLQVTMASTGACAMPASHRHTMNGLIHEPACSWFSPLASTSAATGGFTAVWSLQCQRNEHVLASAGLAGSPGFTCPQPCARAGIAQLPVTMWHGVYMACLAGCGRVQHGVAYPLLLVYWWQSRALRLGE